MRRRECAHCGYVYIYQQQSAKPGEAWDPEWTCPNCRGKNRPRERGG